MFNRKHGRAEHLPQGRYKAIVVQRERIFDATSGTGEISLPQRKVPHRTLREFRSDYRVRDEAMARAYLSRAFTIKEIGMFFGVYYMTVSRAVKKFESSNEEMRECL